MALSEERESRKPERRFVMAKAMNLARWYRNSPNPLQRTPQALFDQLHEEFSFTIDGAASDRNAKLPRYFTKRDDALAQDWSTERVWLNPPYGRGLDKWIRKAYESSLAGATVVILVPSATDLPWWHEYAMHADEIRFIRGRIGFDYEDGRPGANAFYPSSIVVFRPRERDDRGHVQEAHGL